MIRVRVRVRVGVGVGVGVRLICTHNLNFIDVDSGPSDLIEGCGRHSLGFIKPQQ